MTTEFQETDEEKIEEIVNRLDGRLIESILRLRGMHDGLGHKKSKLLDSVSTIISLLRFISPSRREELIKQGRDIASEIRDK